MNTLFAKLCGLLAGRLRQEILWNLGAILIVGLGGVALNALILRDFGADALGIFNQTFAAYIFFSQLAVGGVHLSTLRAVAQNAADRERCNTIIQSAFVLTLAISVIFAAAFWSCRAPIGRLLDSSGVATGIAWATPGLFCFAVNKTLMGALNGLRWMRMYAVVQAIRPLAMLATVVVWSLQMRPGEQLAVALTVAEVIALLVLLAALGGRLMAKSARGFWGWTREHLRFGVRSAGSGVVLELNTRVDVLMLGYFVSDALVGVYSFAAILVEGFAQIPIVLRAVFNPLLAQFVAARDESGLASLFRRGAWRTYVLMGVIGTIAVLLYPLGVAAVSDKPEMAASWSIFGILMSGLVLSAGYIPFNQLLLQAGRPATHTLMTVLILATNALGNAMLIPLWQAHGAAVATAASYVLSIAYLKILIRCQLSVESRH